MQFTVTYENGEAVTYKVKPRHLVEFEENNPAGFVESYTAMSRLAHIVTNDPRPYTEWLADVDDIEADKPEQATPRGGGPKKAGGGGRPVPTPSP